MALDDKRPRQTGRLPTILVEADTLAEGIHKAVIACYERGARVETPKHKPGCTLGYDSHITLNIAYPNKNPMIHKKWVSDGALGVAQYSLEVTHGIHNHWLKSPENPNFWNYTYNGRFNPQIPFMLAKIKRDFEQKGRISGRDFFFTTWVAGEDAILEQEDPPCLQTGQLRFIQDSEGVYHANYLTTWRSHDECKGWNQNKVGQVRLFELLVKKVSSMLGIPIKIGAYIPTSTSLHIYGDYIDRENLDRIIEETRNAPASEYGWSLEDYLGDETQLRRIIAAQMDAEAKGHGKQQPEEKLIDLGYDLKNFQYPSEWDTWPKSWDEAPNPDLLARLVSPEQAARDIAFLRGT